MVGFPSCNEGTPVVFGRTGISQKWRNRGNERTEGMQTLMRRWTQILHPLLLGIPTIGNSPSAKLGWLWKR